jgi:hypothetical protein
VGTTDRPRKRGERSIRPRCPGCNEPAEVTILYLDEGFCACGHCLTGPGPSFDDLIAVVKEQRLAAQLVGGAACP